MELLKWCEINLLDIDLKQDNFLTIEDKKFYIVKSKDVEQNGDLKLFDEDFKLHLDSSDHEDIDYLQPDYFLFCFGGLWYYTSVSKSNIELNIFKYFGKAKQTLKSDYPFLGIHDGYELCNGSRLAEDWIKKAKFLAHLSLGICELNTLAGVLKFQQECLKENIKPIIGETIVVKNEKERYELKLYVRNEIGWRNLLNINSQINVFNEGYVTEEFLIEHDDGLICVVSVSKKLDIDFVSRMNAYFDFEVYYQIDLVKYSSNEKDKENLLNIQDYLKSELKDILPPVLLCDAYYLDQEDYEIKTLLNKIGKVGFKYNSKDQHFKGIDEITFQFNSLGLDDSFLDLCIKNAINIAELCDFKIDIDNFHLPKYIMTKDESEKFETNEDLFFSLIESGFERKIAGKVKDEDEYWLRIDEESKVIKEGDIIDYFLILADIINWCNKEGIIVGCGRGCFLSEENYVTLLSGEKKLIEEIKIGEKLVNYFNKESTVIDKFIYDIDEEIIELKFDSGDKISCTKDHKIFTKNRGWIEAQFINESDEL